MALQANAPGAACDVVERAVVNIGPYWWLSNPTMPVRRDCRPFNDPMGRSSPADPVAESPPGCIFKCRVLLVWLAGPS
jgi:hypothetical protein